MIHLVCVIGQDVTGGKIRERTFSFPSLAFFPRRTRAVLFLPPLDNVKGEIRPGEYMNRPSFFSSPLFTNALARGFPLLELAQAIRIKTNLPAKTAPFSFPLFPPSSFFFLFRPHPFFFMLPFALRPRFD